MSADVLHSRLAQVWGQRPGWLGALAVVNHTNVGRRFIITGLVFFLVAGLQAMLLRTQLAFPGNDFIDEHTYNQLFTLHGTTMMFLFAVPMVEGFAIYLIPKLIGTRDLVFPRLSAYGYWCYLFGGLLLYSSLLVGDVPDDGWFMYTPLSGPVYSPGKGADFWLLGVTLAEVSAVSAAVELIVAILFTRAPGMALRQMPIFAWAMLVVAIMIVFGFPPLILGSILLELERAFGLPFFDATRGGDPLLWQHLFWLFGHPEVYIIFLPAAGMLSTMIPTFAGRPLAGYTWVVVALVSVGFLSFGLWVHHMYAVGIPHLALAFFSAASMAVAIPTGIQVFAWLATLWPSQPRFGVPMLYIYGFFFVFVLGGLTGVMVALVPFDWQVHDTHFVVAHLHYVLIGGVVFPLLAATYYWLPHFCGRLPSHRLGTVGFVLTFVGFNMTFLVMHLTGLLGMPRRVYLYPEGLGWEWTNLLSSIGGFVLAFGTAAFVIDVILHLRHGRPSPPNPWRAGTLEWAMPLPPPPYNFAAIPQVESRYPLWRRDGDPLPDDARGQLAGALLDGTPGYLAHADVERREILGTSPVSARPGQVIVLPGNTLSPLALAAVTALIFVGVLVSQYWLAALAVLGTLLGAAAWAWPREQWPERMQAGAGLELPLHPQCDDRPGYWGLLAALVADGAIAASLLFGYFYYWTVSPQWPPADLPLPSLGNGIAIGAALAASSAVILFGRHRGARPVFAGAALLLLAAVAAAAWMIEATDLSPQLHAYDATVTAMLGWQGVHVIGCLITAGLLWLRRTPLRSERRIAALLWHYTVLQGLAFLLPMLLFPRML